MPLTKEVVLSQIVGQGLVPVFSSTKLQTVIDVTRACYGGGLRTMEFTNRVDGGADIFRGLVEFCAENLPDMVVGVGTILFDDSGYTMPEGTPPQHFRDYLAAGAQFVVGPCFDQEVCVACEKAGIAYSPGCMTPTEIVQAHLAGASMIKLYPGEILGPVFVKGVRAALGRLNAKLMVTGGVEPSLKSLEAWFRAGVDAVGIGSNLFPKEEIAAGRFTSITRRVETTLAMIADLRAEIAE